MTELYRIIGALIGFLAIVMFFIIILIGKAAATPRYDGQWTLSVYNACDKSKGDIVVIIKDAKILTETILLDISGAVSHNGEVNIVATYNGTTFYSVGHFSSNAGAGVWQNDKCSGKWTATRKIS